MKQIDACGRACPEPVLMTKQALKADPAGVQVLVDNQVAVANISRFAQNGGYQISVADKDGVFTLTIQK